MNFDLNDEQRQLRDVLARFVAARYGFEQRQKILRSEAGWSREAWTALAEEIGILGAALPEEVGGFGGGPVDTMLIMEELGRGLVVEPYLETVVTGAGLLRLAAEQSAGEAAESIGAIIEGRMITAFAWAEPNSRFDPALCAAVAVSEGSGDGDGWRLDGRKSVVVAAPFATHLIVSARTAGRPGDRNGVSLFLLPNGAEGMTRTDYATVDGRRASEIVFEHVRLNASALIGREGEALPLIERVLDEARAAICAEALGVLAEMQRRTLEFVKERKQFGVAIGQFQVLQHRLVDMFMEVEQARSMVLMATLKLDAEPRERARAVSAAKAYVGKACRFVGQQAVQTHGGIGLTDELALSHYFKRAAMIESQLGSVDDHLARYEAMAASAAQSPA